MTKRSNHRPASRSLRNNDGESPTIKSGSEINSSGKKIREVHPTDKSAKKIPNRHQLNSAGQKRPRSQSELRDSTREPARGRAEFTGQMNKRLTNQGNQVRTGKTASKGKGRAESR